MTFVDHKFYPVSFTLYLLIFGFFVGSIISLSSPFLVILIIIACPLFIFSILKPEIGILVITILTSSIIFEEGLPLIPIAIGSLHLADVLLLILLCKIPYKVISDSKFRLVKTPMVKPLLVFYLVALFSSFIAIVYFSVDINIVLRKFRHVTYYLIFFVVINLIREKKQIKFLLIGLFSIATVVSITMIIQAIVGEPPKLMPGRVETLITLGEMQHGVTRIIPPGETLVYIMFLTMVCVVVFKKVDIHLVSHIFITALLGIGLILTFARNCWISILFSLVIFTFLTSKKYKFKFISVILVLIMIGVSLLIFSSPGSKVTGIITSTSNRMQSLLTGKEILYSSSLEDRYIEIEHAVDRIFQYPIFGIGLGNSFIQDERWPDDKGIYIHNSYLWILMKMGIIGFVPFLWLFVTFLIRGFINWRNIDDRFLKAVVIGFTLSCLGLMITNMVAPKFMEWRAITIIGIIFGLNEIIIRNKWKEDCNS